MKDLRTILEEEILKAMKIRLEETKKATGFQLVLKVNRNSKYDVTLIDKTNKCEVNFEDVHDLYLYLEGMSHIYNTKKINTKEV